VKQVNDIPYNPATFRTKRTVPGVIKAFDDEEGILEGYASLAGVLDSYNEIVDKGAFKRTLKEHEDRIALCWQHDWHEVIGRIEELREVSRSKLPKPLQEQYPEATGGLYFRSQVLDTRQGKDAKVLLRAKAIKELSIGYDLYDDGSYKDDDGIVHLKHIRLYEISPVTMGANPGAQVESYKAEPCDIPYGKPEETEDFIRIPNPGQGDCEVTATITISAEEGIQALYCGKIKKVRTFIFAKAKGWTMAKAQKWVDDHKDEFKSPIIGIEEFVVEFGKAMVRHSDQELMQSHIIASTNKILELLLDNRLEEGYALLRALVSELPQPTLGEAEELALRISILEAETEVL